MAGVNKVILVGNLGADPEIRHLESGSKVANISIATSESYTNRNGERVEQTEWHRVELWDRLADLCEKYLSKGRTVYIEGKIRTNEYQDKEGITRYDKRIRATNMTFVGGRNDEGDAAQRGADQQGVAQQGVAQQSSDAIASSASVHSTGQQSAGQQSAPPASAPSSAPAPGMPATDEMDDLPF